MEQNLPVVAKKFWHMVKVAYFMLRKGISKGKLIADLNMMMNRRKIAGKLAAINKLMFHHHSSAATRGHRDETQLSYPEPQDEYEFRCRDRPAFLPNIHLPFHLNKRKHSHAPPQEASIDIDDLLAAAVEIAASSAAASPALPGFGRTPAVRQLRITDSPFPLQNVDEGDNHIDEAAEKFIMKFYKDLKRQSV